MQPATITRKLPLSHSAVELHAFMETRFSESAVNLMVQDMDGDDSWSRISNETLSAFCREPKQHDQEDADYVAVSNYGFDDMKDPGVDLNEWTIVIDNSAVSCSSTIQQTVDSSASLGGPLKSNATPAKKLTLRDALDSEQVDASVVTVDGQHGIRVCTTSCDKTNAVEQQVSNENEATDAKASDLASEGVESTTSDEKACAESNRFAIGEVACSLCTYLNEDGATHCQMCDFSLVYIGSESNVDWKVPLALGGTTRRKSSGGFRAGLIDFQNFSKKVLRNYFDDEI